MTASIDKATIIQQTRTSYAEVEALIAPLGEAQMLRTDAEGGWSAKDHLAHLAFWNRWLLRSLEAAHDGTTPEPDEEMNGADAETDQINQRIYLADRDRALADVRADFHNSSERIIELLGAFSEDDLTNPQRFSWRNGSPLVAHIAGNTYEHYPEHVETIRALVSR